MVLTGGKVLAREARETSCWPDADEELSDKNTTTNKLRTTLEEIFMVFSFQVGGNGRVTC
jgi:hypothetical protein